MLMNSLKRLDHYVMTKPNHLSVWVSTSPLKTKTLMTPLTTLIMLFDNLRFTHTLGVPIYSMSWCSYHGDVKTEINHCQVGVEHDTN